LHQCTFIFVRKFTCVVYKSTVYIFDGEKLAGFCSNLKLKQNVVLVLFFIS